MAGFNRAMPVLQVHNVTASTAFYCDKLGFASHGFWTDEDPDRPEFCIVQRGDVTLALDRARDGSVPLNQYWAAYVYVEDADALHAELAGLGVDIVEPPRDTGYGLREFTLRDPDGHLIAFAHDAVRHEPFGNGLGPARGRDGAKKQDQ